MTYDDIVEAQRKRDVKAAITPGAKRGSRKQQNPKTDERKRSHAEELEHGRREKSKHSDWRSIVLSCNFDFGGFVSLD
jgi:hypothetical protein